MRSNFGEGGVCVILPRIAELIAHTPHCLLEESFALILIFIWFYFISFLARMLLAFRAFHAFLSPCNLYARNEMFAKLLASSMPSFVARNSASSN